MVVQKKKNVENLRKILKMKKNRRISIEHIKSYKKNFLYKILLLPNDWASSLASSLILKLVPAIWSNIHLTDYYK